MTFGLHVYPEPAPSGSTLQDNTNYHHLFRKDDIDFFNKHHKSTIRNIEGVSSTIPHEELYQHTSVTSLMNDLGNFNPTNKGLNYYEETESHKALHNTEQRPRMGYHDNYNLDIPDKIDFMSKKKLPHTLSNMIHSLSLA